MREECDKCCPDGFHVDPAWMHGRPAMGWEAKPKMYKKRGDEYVGTDELRADTEAQIMRPPQDEIDALAKKRNDPNRLKPLTDAQKEKAKRIAEQFTAAYEEKLKEIKTAEEEEWRKATSDLRMDA